LEKDMEKHATYAVDVVDEDHTMLDIKNVQLVAMVNQEKFIVTRGIPKKSPD
jgi:hypothetical protein